MVCVRVRLGVLRSVIVLVLVLGKVAGHTLRVQHKERLRAALEKLDLLSLQSVPGALNPSLLELSPGECQFALLEDLNRDINDNCGDFRAQELKYNKCRMPKMKRQGKIINQKCCKHCSDCQGCEGLRALDENVYEKDSPGEVSTDPCTCRDTWEYKGVTYKGCSLTPHYEYTFCYVMNGVTCTEGSVSHEVGEPRKWRPCDSTESPEMKKTKEKDEDASKGGTDD